MLFRTAILTMATLALAGCRLGAGNNVKVDYYAISGSSTTELEADIRRKGPRIGANAHAVAVARIKMIPTVRYRRRAGLCAVSNPKVTVNAHVTLPRWTGRGRATKKLGTVWDNMDRYTRLHETVHVAIAFRYAKRMEDALRALPPLESCARMKARVTALADTYLEEHDKAQRQFDRDEEGRFAQVASGKKPGRRHE